MYGFTVHNFPGKMTPTNLRRLIVHFWQLPKPSWPIILRVATDANVCLASHKGFVCGSGVQRTVRFSSR